MLALDETLPSTVVWNSATPPNVGPETADGSARVLTSLDDEFINSIVPVGPDGGAANAGAAAKSDNAPAPMMVRWMVLLLMLGHRFTNEQT